MQIERAMTGIETLGPGQRFVVWVNGCRRRCKGCVSERLQHFNAFNEKEIPSYFSQFNLDNADGITFSGGEPFEQAEELAKAVKYFRGLGKNDILIYTGYTIEELKGKNDPNVNYVLDNIAVLIDGPYVPELDDGRGNLKGSSNQRVIFLNPAVKPDYDKFYSDKRSMQEFYLGKIVIAAGIPDKQYIKKFRD